MVEPFAQVVTDADIVFTDIMEKSLDLKALLLDDDTSSQMEEQTEAGNERLENRSVIGFDSELFATRLGETLANAQKKTKEGTAESERQQNVMDASNGYRLM